MNSKAILVVGCALLLALPAAMAVGHEKDTPAYRYASKGTRIFSNAAGTFIAKMLVEKENLGANEVRIAELTFPAGYAGRGHLHDAIEIFYVLSGRFGHSVNGKAAILAPGEIGIVRPGDTVTHSVPGETPARVLTIWVPGSGSPDFSGMKESPIK